MNAFTRLLKHKPCTQLKHSLTHTAVYPHNWTVASLTYRRRGKRQTPKAASVTCLIGHRSVSFLFRRLDFSVIINRCNYAPRLKHHKSQSPSLGVRWSRHAHAAGELFASGTLECRFVSVASATRISLEGERQKSMRFHLSEPSSVVWNGSWPVSLSVTSMSPTLKVVAHSKSGVCPMWRTLPTTASHNFTL